MKTQSQLKTLVKLVSLILILLPGLAHLGIVQVRGAESISTLKQSEQPIPISGWMTVLWGDGGPSSNVTKGPIYLLVEKNVPPVIIEISEKLERDLGGFARLMKKRVVVHGKWIHSLNQLSGPATFQAQTIQFQEESDVTSSSAVSSSQSWVSILCKFGDIAKEPNPLSYFQGMYSSSYPGLDHYWREQSYDRINLQGSGAAGWFTLPQPRSYYFYSDGDLNLGRAADDCIAVADPSVDFSGAVGINMMFNGDLDTGGWGSSGWVQTLDGVRKSRGLTWLSPALYQNVAGVEHEMGHTFGLPHSSAGPSSQYDNQWDVMSDMWSNCERSTDATYGCFGQHTISPFKDRLGWIPAELKFTAPPMTTPATVTLEQLALPQTGNYRMAIIPIQNSSTHYYTAEVRRWAGYDVKLPGQGVIIHEVIDGFTYVLDVDNNGNTGDEAAIWRPGETFSDPANQITVTVNYETASSINLTISNSGRSDNTNPNISWIAPVGDNQTYDVGNETIQLEVSASDDVGISHVVFHRWDYMNQTHIELGTVNSPPYRINFDASTLLPDSNQVFADAYDIAGNSASNYIMLNHRSAPRDLIFADGFESGNLSAWSSCTRDGGDLSITQRAKYGGNYGMRGLLDDNASIYCASDQPNAESHYLAGFYFDPNSIAMVSDDTHVIFGGYTGTSTLVLRLQFQKSLGAYKVQAALLDDASTWQTISWFTISDSYHQIELDWRAASAVGANNGGLTLWIDGVLKGDLNGADNDTLRIDRVRLGGVAGIDAGTRGTYYFDEFESRRGDKGPEPTVTLTVNKTGTGNGTVTSNPAGINCSSDCSEAYTPNSSVVLTAAAASGSNFIGWNGAGCSGTNPCTVMMTADTSVTANFDLAPNPGILLGNPTFENDANNDGKPDIWSTNAKFTRSTAIPAMDGSYVGRFRATDNTGATIKQVVKNLTAGSVYDFSGWVNIPATLDSFTFKIQVKWRNANNTVISTTTIKTYTVKTTSWNEARVSMVAPIGATNAIVQMVVNNLNATIYVDKFSFVLK